MWRVLYGYYSKYYSTYLLALVMSAVHDKPFDAGSASDRGSVGV
jgi:hypothetical protein